MKKENKIENKRKIANEIANEIPLTFTFLLLSLNTSGWYSFTFGALMILVSCTLGASVSALIKNTPEPTKEN